MTVKPAKITIKQWHLIVDSGAVDRRNYQLIAGQIFEMAPENPIHSGSILRLSDRLKKLFTHEPVIISQGHPITIEDSEPEPDIAILKYRDEYYCDQHPGADEVYLVIEIANSSLNFDRENKKQIYAKARIIEYWIVDLNSNALIVHRDPTGNDYNSIETKSTGTITTVAFPRIEVEVEKIF